MFGSELDRFSEGMLRNTQHWARAYFSGKITKPYCAADAGAAPATRSNLNSAPAFPSVSRVGPTHFKPLPDFTPDRLADRIAEALRVATDPAKLREFPSWTQQVMRILKDQLIPREYASVLSGDGSIFAEGVSVAWAAKARDLAQAREVGDGRFAQRLGERLALDARTQEVAIQVESGAYPASAEFQHQVMNRLFAPNFAERRAFVEGLALGNRLPELLDRQAKRSTTDATVIYLLLWLYWPEISRLGSIREVAGALEPFFAENKNLAGANWDERIRKLANRLGLSFRSRQSRRRRKVVR